MFPLGAFLSAQKNVAEFNLSISIQNCDNIFSDLGFHVFCADNHGNRLTWDQFPVLDSVVVLKYNGSRFQGNSGARSAIETEFTFLIQVPWTYQGVQVVVEDSDENDGWKIPHSTVSVLNLYSVSNSIQLNQLWRRWNCKRAVLNIQPIQEDALIQEFVGDGQIDSLEFLHLLKGSRLERRMVERQGWQFEKSWYKVKGKSKSTIKTLYRIRPADKEDWILELLGEEYANEKLMSIMHPDIRDVNFDGIPDLHISNGNDGLDRYFGFNLQSGNFEELFISKLMNLKVDYVFQKIEGDLLQYEEGESEPLAKIHYQLEGPHWASVHCKRQELRKSLKRLAPKVESNVLFSEVRNDFKYELQLYNDNGSVENQYRRLAIYPNGGSTVLFEDSISPMQDIKDHRVDSFFLVVKDYNHDNVPDVYWPKMGPDQSEVFYLSETTDGKLSFNKIEGLSYTEVMMMQGDVSFLTNKMKLQEYDDFNLDGWLDYRVFTQMDKTNGFWSYFIFHSANNSFQYSTDFSMLDHCSVNKNSNHICAWQELETIDGHKRLVRYHLNNGQLVVAK